MGFLEESIFIQSPESESARGGERPDQVRYGTLGRYPPTHQCTRRATAARNRPSRRTTLHWSRGQSDRSSRLTRGDRGGGGLNC